MLLCFNHAGDSIPPTLPLGDRLIELERTARALVAPGKGILAADESTGTATKRLQSVGIESTPENRGAYRHMLFSTPGLGKFVSGTILYSETLKQEVGGVPLVKLLTDQGIIPGLKVDGGTEPFPIGAPADSSIEKVTKGLDELPKLLAEAQQYGAKFTKWRAVITISGDDIPSKECIAENADRLAKYAKLVQDAGLVPIVEPEVLMDGNHSTERCEEVTKLTLKAVFEALRKHDVYLPGIILKPNMIVPGKDSSETLSCGVVAQLTLLTLKECVPPEVPGIAFLSGGLSSNDAMLCLHEMNAGKFTEDHPWQLTFSYGRALQNDALKAWANEGRGFAVAAGQAALMRWASANPRAASGDFLQD